MKKVNIVLIIIACLTLGLAPFYPEPHVWQKLLWLIKGNSEMELLDYLDFTIHGLPWVILIAKLISIQLNRKI